MYITEAYLNRRFFGNQNRPFISYDLTNMHHEYIITELSKILIPTTGIYRTGNLITIQNSAYSNHFNLDGKKPYCRNSYTDAIDIWMMLDMIGVKYIHVNPPMVGDIDCQEWEDLEDENNQCKMAKTRLNQIMKIGIDVAKLERVVVKNIYKPFRHCLIN